MYPSWETVEYASTFLMSYCRSPIVAANSAVSAPMPATTGLESGARANSTLVRMTRYPPAVTMVAAWISAEAGVGPAIASGSQVYSGICADFPVQPRNRKRVMAVTVALPAGRIAGALATIPVNVSVPKECQIMNIATRNPKSPIRLTMNAFLPASALTLSLNQNPINRYEQRPTPSHPMNMTGKLDPSTSTSMNTTNRFR